MKEIEFYFDPISPYVYLAWTQLPRLLSEVNASLRCIPILFAGLLNTHGQKGPAEIPSKRMYTFQDVFRWVDHYGVPLTWPPTHPFNPLASLRICVALENEKDRQRWTGGILEACWQKGLDITEEGVLRKLAQELGLDADELWKRAHTVEVKEQLKTNTQNAIEKGIFGVPTFRVNGEIFWGNDRLNFLKEYLMGRNPMDEAKIKELSERPRGAERKV